MKNVILLGLLTMISLSYAKEPIEQESMEEAEKFKIEKAVKEKTAGRTFAGDKAKKEVPGSEVSKDEIVTGDDSEVRFWRYSE